MVSLVVAEAESFRTEHREWLGAVWGPLCSPPIAPGRSSPFARMRVQREKNALERWEASTRAPTPPPTTLDVPFEKILPQPPQATPSPTPPTPPPTTAPTPPPTPDDSPYA